jgi:RNA polymerase sigma-70 factor (ECF subfamily)
VPAEYLSKQPDGNNPHAVTERREFALILEEAVRGLRPEYAELIALKYEHDLTIEDIAEITGLAIGTIKSSLHRARKDLADSLRRRGLSTTP